MAYDDYLKAQKLALKAYKNKTVRGAYPYLPVLDEILSHVRIEREEILGTVNIPLKQVVGTSSAGRTQAFAVGGSTVFIHGYINNVCFFFTYILSAGSQSGCDSSTGGYV
mgnify:CR=1 FL=1